MLLDAPCSSTGTVRRHPDVVWTKTPDDIAKLAELQARMLDHALGSVAVVASQAFHVTGRAAPPALKETLDFIREAAPPLEGRTRPGPHSGAAIGAIRTRIYGAS